MPWASPPRRGPSRGPGVSMPHRCWTSGLHRQVPAMPAALSLAELWEVCCGCFHGPAERRCTLFRSYMCMCSGPAIGPRALGLSARDCCCEGRISAAQTACFASFLLFTALSSAPTPWRLSGGGPSLRERNARQTKKIHLQKLQHHRAQRLKPFSSCARCRRRPMTTTLLMRGSSLGHAALSVTSYSSWTA